MPLQQKGELHFVVTIVDNFLIFIRENKFFFNHHEFSDG